MDATITQTEIDCIKALAALYLAGHTDYFCQSGHEALGLTPENFATILGLMEHYGAIENAQHAGGQPYFMFRVTPHAVQLARRIEAKEAEPPKRKNVVEDIKYTLQCHPVAGWLFVAFTAITLLATAITQIGGALKVVGILK